MNALYIGYVQVCNFGESPVLVIMLLDFHQNYGLRNICHMHIIYLSCKKERLKPFNTKCYDKKEKKRDNRV